MTRLVVDASVAIEILLRSTLGRAAQESLRGAVLLAPELLDVEVMAGLRRAVLAGLMSPERGRQAIDALARWPIDRIRHRRLLVDAWSLRDNVTAYDALYVATARRFDAELVTADGPLARAPSLGVVVRNLRV